MPRRKRRRSQDVSLPAGAILPVFLIAAVIVFGGPVLLSALAIVFQLLAQVPPEYQTAVGCLVLWVGGFAVIGVVLLGVRWVQKARQEAERRALARRMMWEQVMADWQQARSDNHDPIQFQSTRGLSPRGLEDFAAQVFRRAGYQATVVGRTGDHGIDVKLVNPLGQVEVVQCKQYDKPVGEKTVRELIGAMQDVKAVRAYLWAPKGFTAPAIHYASRHPVTLADEMEIARLVEVTYRASDGVGR